MKIKITTPRITMELEDETTFEGNRTNRYIPELGIAIENAVKQAIKLHNEIITVETLEAESPRVFKTSDELTGGKDAKATFIEFGDDDDRPSK